MAGLPRTGTSGRAGQRTTRALATPDVATMQVDPGMEDRDTRVTMQRSISQLLFSYLPGKTVDWEGGVAIVHLQNVRLSSSWDNQRSQLVLAELAAYLQRWEAEGGRVHPSFPDPLRESGRYTVGTPESIDGDLLECALHCLSCSRLVFASRAALARREGTSNPFRCPSCGKGPLRQFPQVFVHGCGHLVTVNEWMPAMKRVGEGWDTTKYPLRCPRCGEAGIPQIDGRSERAKDLIVTCQRCKGEITSGRLNARCPECVRALARGELAPPTPGAPASDTGERGQSQEATAVSQVAMRVTSYRASEAYYGHTLTILRLDRPELAYTVDAELEMLRQLVPDQGPAVRERDPLLLMRQLLAEAEQARSRGDSARMQTIMERLRRLSAGEQPEPSTPLSGAPLANQAPDLRKAITESLAFKTQVRTRAYQEVLGTDSTWSGATTSLRTQLSDRHQALGLRDTQLVEDLPIITATFGFTRRSFEATYDEYDGSQLPTQLRPFYVLDNYAAKRLDRPGAAGTVPILAREGEHEGLFFQLEPERVLRWLERNGVRLPRTAQPPIVRILEACEGVDRYYDRIWEAPVRRLVFGLVHSLSHAAMRMVSQTAGIERTSLGEYVFLPLLGTVVYANNSTFRMGNMETMLRSTFYEFLDRLSTEALDCLFDPDCRDHQGACAGCLHAPEICCRVFNHGLSRALLIGGHVPWEDVSVNRRLVGYWELGDA